MDGHDAYLLRNQRADGSWEEWREVTKAEWIRAERGAGFTPKGVAFCDPAYLTKCATSSFGRHPGPGRTDGIEGRVERREPVPAPRI